MFKNIETILSRVRAALRRRGASPHDAEDWSQEAWLRMSLHTEDHAVPNPEGYLIRAAINISIDAYRSKSAHGEEALLEDVVVADMAPTPDAQLLGKERLERMWRCMDRLPPRTREMFLAHRVADRTYAEIGREFGVSEAVVAKHVAKATALLTAWMEGW